MHPKFPLKQAAWGNGAVTSWFHAGGYCRAVPEPHRSMYVVT